VNGEQHWSIPKLKKRGDRGTLRSRRGKRKKEVLLNARYERVRLIKTYEGSSRKETSTEKMLGGVGKA